MFRNARYRVLLVAFGGALALAACGGSGADTSASPTVAEQPPTETPDATASVAPTPEPAPTQEPVQEKGGDSSEGALVYDFSAVSPVVDTFVTENELNGAGLIVVQREDGVVYEDYWGEFDKDRISLVASSSKMITAGVLLRLDDSGLLDLDAPIADVVEWGTGNPDITVAQLLSNSSGLVGLFPNPTYAPYFCQYLANGTMQECAEAIFTTPDDDAEVIEPDAEFRYGGAQWQVAGAVAEVASGKSWAELINETYVQPCGLTALAYNNHFVQLPNSGFSYPVAFEADPSTLAPTENPNMEAGAYITTGDYGALLLMHLRGGKCGENQVLSADAVDRLHSDRILDEYGGNADGSDFGYGMGWWVDRTTGRLSDGGAYGSVPWLDLEDGYGAYLVIESDGQTGSELAEELFDLVEAAIAG